MGGTAHGLLIDTFRKSLTFTPKKNLFQDLALKQHFPELFAHQVLYGSNHCFFCPDYSEDAATGAATAAAGLAGGRWPADGAPAAAAATDHRRPAAAAAARHRGARVQADDHQTAGRATQRRGRRGHHQQQQQQRARRRRKTGMRLRGM